MTFSPYNREEGDCLKFSGKSSEMKAVIDYINECCCPICGVELEEHYELNEIGENMLVHISCPTGDYAYDVD